MQKRKALWLCFTLSAICLAAIPPSETDDAARIIQAARTLPLENNPYRRLDRRTVGGRVPGTPAMQRAVDWGVQMFKDCRRRQRPHRGIHHPVFLVGRARPR